MSDKGFKTFRGGTGIYMEIASRGEERLGFKMEYAIHPMNGLGFFIVRFAAHNQGKKPENFTHFTPRNTGKYLDEAGNCFLGVRLNKIAIPVFDPGPKVEQIGEFGDKFGIWAVIAEWVEEQAKDDGFEMIVPEFSQILRDMVAEDPKEPLDVKMVLDFPDFKVAKLLKEHPAEVYNDEVADSEGEGPEGEEGFDA